MIITIENLLEVDLLTWTIDKQIIDLKLQRKNIKYRQANTICTCLINIKIS
jgi:hypothetical protein